MENMELNENNLTHSLDKSRERLLTAVKLHKYTLPPTVALGLTVANSPIIEEGKRFIVQYQDEIIKRVGDLGYKLAQSLPYIAFLIMEIGAAAATYYSYKYLSNQEKKT